jgi:hypothetical protein
MQHYDIYIYYIIIFFLSFLRLFNNKSVIYKLFIALPAPGGMAHYILLQLFTVSINLKFLIYIHSIHFFSNFS